MRVEMRANARLADLDGDGRYALVTTVNLIFAATEAPEIEF